MVEENKKGKQKRYKSKLKPITKDKKAKKVEDTTKEVAPRPTEKVEGIKKEVTPRPTEKVTNTPKVSSAIDTINTNTTTKTVDGKLKPQDLTSESGIFAKRLQDNSKKVTMSTEKVITEDIKPKVTKPNVVEDTITVKQPEIISGGNVTVVEPKKEVSNTTKAKETVKPTTLPTAVDMTQVVEDNITKSNVTPVKQKQVVQNNTTVVTNNQKVTTTNNVQNVNTNKLTTRTTTGVNKLNTAVNNKNVTFDKLGIFTRGESITAKRFEQSDTSSLTKLQTKKEDYFNLLRDIRDNKKDLYKIFFIGGVLILVDLIAVLLFHISSMFQLGYLTVAILAIVYYSYKVIKKPWKLEELQNDDTMVSLAVKYGKNITLYTQEIGDVLSISPDRNQRLRLSYIDTVNGHQIEVINRIYYLNSPKLPDFDNFIIYPDEFVVFVGDFDRSEIRKGIRTSANPKLDDYEFTVCQIKDSDFRY